MQIFAELYKKTKEILLMIWNGAAAEQDGTQIFLVILAFAAFAVVFYLLISFLRAPWKEKLQFLFTLAVTIVIAAVLFWALIKF